MTLAATASGRRARLIDVAAALASDGGFDGVQMREVALRAPVALATLYRNFPSKPHLLVAVLQSDLDRIQDRIDRVILRTSDPHDRLMTVVGALTRSMQRDPRRCEATTRAMMSADATLADEVGAVRDRLDGLFARALSPGEPDTQQQVVGRIVGDVWLANLLAWVGGRESNQDVVDRMAEAATLVLGRRAAREPV